MVYADRVSISNLHVNIQEYKAKLVEYESTLKESFDNLQTSNLWYDDKYIEFKKDQMNPLFDQAMVGIYNQIDNEILPYLEAMIQKLDVYDS